jgi:hypothetical protein
MFSRKFLPALANFWRDRILVRVGALGIPRPGCSTPAQESPCRFGQERSFQVADTEADAPLRSSIRDLQGIGVYSSDVVCRCCEASAKGHSVQSRDQSRSPPEERLHWTKNASGGGEKSDPLHLLMHYGMSVRLRWRGLALPRAKCCPAWR